MAIEIIFCKKINGALWNAGIHVMLSFNIFVEEKLQNCKFN